MKKNSKIYVAGHKGLVGSALLRKLQEKGYTNIIFRTSNELNLMRQNDVEIFFKKEEPEYVFLAAGRVGGIIANNTYKADFIYDNIMIAANVINASYKYGVKKLLNLGSSCIYPRTAPQPLKEEYLLTDILEPTNEPYAIAKIAAIKLCKYYNEQYGTNFISVMPTNLYGENDNFDFKTSHVFPALIRKFYLAKLLSEGKYREISYGFKLSKSNSDIENTNENEETINKNLSRLGIKKETSSSPTVVELWGSGKPYREFLYVGDLVDACIIFVEKFNYTDIGEIINIGTGKDLQIKELAEMIKDIVGFRGRIIWDTSKPDGTPKKLLDVSRAKALGWQSKIELEEGIKLTYEWFEKKMRRTFALPGDIIK